MRTSASRALAGLVVLVAAAVGLAACTTSTGTKGNPSRGTGSTTPAAAGTTAGGHGGGSLATSKLIGLTKLTNTQLCGVMSTAEAAQILSGATAGKFTDTLGLGIICEWQAGGNKELYVGLSTILDWAGAQAIDKLLTTTPDTIDGHPVLVAAPQKSLTYATVDVALAGDHDPVAEFRAPSVDQAKSMASLVTPRLLALS